MLHSYVRAAATCTAYRLIGSLNRSFETHYLWQLALQLPWLANLNQDSILVDYLSGQQEERQRHMHSSIRTNQH